MQNRNSIQSISLMILSSLLFLCVSCNKTHLKIEPTQQQEQTANFPPTSNIKEHARDSSVDIEYVLGRDHYRFVAQGKGDLVTANTYLDKEKLDEGTVDQTQYTDFLQKAFGFISNSLRHPSSPPIPCKSPFTVTVRLKDKTHVTHGCRSTDDGALSKLVKDGEFLLLYSKN